MKILIAAPVYQKEHIFIEYLKGLDGLVYPQEWQVDRMFILHNCPELEPLIKGKADYLHYATMEKYQTDDFTHRWSDLLIATVAAMKNEIIKTALSRGYDYLFLVDSDLVLHPLTLMQLWQADKDIIAECFWTRWQPDTKEMPNAWNFNNYEFYNERVIATWKEPGVYRVGMTGACTLIRRKVLEAGVNFDKVYNLNFWGEDRHFCVRAAAYGFDIWLDTHCPPAHLYREAEYLQYMAARYELKQTSGTDQP